MTKLFLDTNVVIDFLCERGNYYLPAARLVTSAYRGEVGIFCSALTFATASYLMNRYKITNEDIFEKLKNFSTLCIPTLVDAKIVERALNSSFQDLEDAMQYFSALSEEVSGIVTRNGKDFAISEIPIYTPEEAIKLINS